MNTLEGQQVLVLGLGISGLAMARWCHAHGAVVTVADTRDAPPHLEKLRAELPDVEFKGGEFNASLIEGTGIRAVFKSPGLTPASTASVIDAARAQGLWVGGELSLFAKALADLKQSQSYQPQVLAITGTNGKTTVTSLTTQLVKRCGKSVVMAGNIGPSMLDTLSEKVGANDLPEVWVLELSSFQLEDSDGFEPTAATVLNVSQDHLDWHGSMQAYAASKAKIFGSSPATIIVLNRDDPEVMKMLPVPTYVMKGAIKTPVHREYLSFGADLPTRPGDFGIDVVNGMAWLARALEADETRKRRRDDAEEIHIQRLMPADALRIRGRHNAVNALSALALAASAGCALGAMLYGLREYRGEPHRVEPVGIIGDVEYFDDSKGTNVGATAAALSGLGADRRVVVILGGVGKDQDFTPLAQPVSRFVRAVVLMGRDAPIIRAALAPTGVPMHDAADMHQAVRIAAEQAREGDAVLMSPACASFDMFDNYEHRATVFREAVAALEFVNVEGV